MVAELFVTESTETVRLSYVSVPPSSKDWVAGSGKYSATGTNSPLTLTYSSPSLSTVSFAASGSSSRIPSLSSTATSVKLVGSAAS